MATIRKQIRVAADPARVWSVIGDFADGPVRMAPGYVLTSRIDEESEDTRIVEFADGNIVRERLVGIDQQLRRIAYSVVGFEHSNSSMQVIATDDGGSRFVWIHDVLPDELAGQLESAMDGGLDTIGRTFGAVSVPG